VGQPYSQSHVQEDRANIVANYIKAGYLTSSFRETATEVSKNDPHHIEVVYHIYEGPQVNTGNVLTLGRNHTRQRIVDLDVSEIKPGQPLTETELLTAGSNLYDHTGVFDWAEVDPKRRITPKLRKMCWSRFTKPVRTNLLTALASKLSIAAAVFRVERLRCPTCLPSVCPPTSPPAR